MQTSDVDFLASIFAAEGKIPPNIEDPLNFPQSGEFSICDTNKLREMLFMVELL
jgi:hypothetical protein